MSKTDAVKALCLEELDKLKDEYISEQDRCEQYSPGYWWMDHKIDAINEAIKRIEDR